MGFLNKLFNNKKRSNQQSTTLKNEFTYSDELKINESKENIPEDFITRGVNLYNMSVEFYERASSEERRIFELTGLGLYYEDQEQYEKAIENYQEADDLTMELLKDEIDAEYLLDIFTKDDIFPDIDYMVYY